MKAIIEKSKYLNLIAVVTLLVTFILTLLWGVARAVVAWYKIVSSYGQSSEISLSVIKLIDTFLIALVLYLLAASIYFMFIDEIGKPSRMVARSLNELKSKLSSLVVLVICVHFVEVLFENSIQAIDIFWIAVATALVSGVLIAFAYLGNKKDEEQY